MTLVRKSCEEYVQSAELLLNFDKLCTMLNYCGMVGSQRSMANLFPGRNSHTHWLAELNCLPIIPFVTLVIPTNIKSKGLLKLIKSFIGKYI